MADELDGMPVNRKFQTLDEYLAFIEMTQAPVDGPWYREIRPGIYELQLGGNLHLDSGEPPKKTYTRAELMEKFGFTR